jgi:hypothetical protein
MYLGSHSDKELAELQKALDAEKTRRKEEADAAALKVFQEWAAKINSPEIVDIIAPRHCRTSCSDTNRSNGIDSMTSGRTAPRCVRCTLLEFVDEGGYHGSEPFQLTVTLGG